MCPVVINYSLNEVGGRKICEREEKEGPKYPLDIRNGKQTKTHPIICLRLCNAEAPFGKFRLLGKRNVNECHIAYAKKKYIYI